MNIIPHNLEECSKISCMDCHFRDTTIYGYGSHIDGSPFPLYDFSRCVYKKCFENGDIFEV